MGEIKIGNYVFPISGEEPNQEEWKAIKAAIASSQPSRQQPMPDLNAAISASASPTLPREEAPGVSAIDLSKAYGFSTKYGSPLEALGGLWRGEKEAWGDVGKLFNPANVGGSVIAPLSTGDPVQRQEIIAKQVPGAKAVFDAYGNPMIEIDGKRYHASDPIIDYIARPAAGVTGGMLASPLIPATAAGVVIGGGLLAGAQSVGEDVVAKAAGGEHVEGYNPDGSRKTATWVDPEKALISAGFGALIPLGIMRAVPIAGKLNELIRRGTPLTDDALRQAGLTTEQINSLTPELRQQVTTAVRQTFGDQGAVGATYRTGLADEFLTGGGPGNLTRGEISQDAGKLATEQTLAVPKDVRGRAEAAATINANRKAQDVKVDAAKETILRQTGGAGQPRTASEAGDIFKGAYNTADEAAAANVDTLYATARDPAVLTQQGLPVSVPSSNTTSLGQVVRSNLEGHDIGRIALGTEAENLTPNAAAALKAIDRWSAATAKAGSEYGPANVTWREIEDLRQTLVGYAQAAARGSKQDQSAVAQIMKSFDDHLASQNPLYEPARAAHAERMSTFKPGGGVDQDKATKAVLKAMEGPEPGAAVTNTILGAKKSEAIQMIDHLNDKVFANQPEARQALQEQFLRRLFFDKDGNSLSPQKTATAIAKAFGDEEGPLYQRLFSGGQISELRRFHELMKVLGESREPINPSRSGLIMQAVLDQRNARNMGAAIGGAIGYPIGGYWGGAAGAAVGGGAGSVVGGMAPPRIARAAVNPPSGYFQQPATNSRAPGLLGAVGGGPADRLMEGLLMD